MNSDAHNTLEFDVRYGVAQARRGRVERSDVVNARPWKRPWKQFEQWRRKRR